MRSLGRNGTDDRERNSRLAFSDMRWQDLFADLEGQAGALEWAEIDAEVADRTRGEIAQVTLLNRIRAQVGQHIALTTSGAGSLSGPLLQVGANWLLLNAPDEVVVPGSAIITVSNLPTTATGPAGVGRVTGRLPMTAALRAIAIDRCAVTVLTRAGDKVTGTPDRVGADFVDLAVHELGEAPRRSTVRGRVTVSFDAIGAVRRSGQGWL